jgi:Na+/H+-dicarboxylate symporter
MACATERNNIPQKIIDFILPIGATINMDGTALYQGVAAIFIAQIYGIPIGPLEIVLIILTATIGSIGTAGIPQGSLVTMAVVLRSAGIPAEGIAAILSIDWFLDRCRTTINVWGDVVISAVIASIYGEIEVKKIHQPAEEALLTGTDLSS